MKSITLLGLIVFFIGFSSCEKEKIEEVVYEVNTLLVDGDYSGTYTNVSGEVGSLITTTTNNYQINIVSDPSDNLIYIKGKVDNEIALVTTILSTSDGITYIGSLEDSDMRYFSFNVNTERIELDLYQNDEQKNYDGYKQ